MIEWLGEFVESLDREFSMRPKIGTLATVEVCGALGETTGERAGRHLEPQGAAGVAARARSVVCRRVDESGGLWITSDGRSGKNAQVRANASGEMVFWLAGLRRQYRLGGTVAILEASGDEADGERTGQWRALSDATRATFTWPAPGGPREEDAAYGRAVGAEVDPPVAFEVLVLSPVSVDVLDLGRHPHRRRVWRLEGGIWTSAEVSP